MDNHPLYIQFIQFFVVLRRVSVASFPTSIRTSEFGDEYISPHFVFTTQSTRVQLEHKLARERGIELGELLQTRVRTYADYSRVVMA